MFLPEGRPGAFPVELFQFYEKKKAPLTLPKNGVKEGGRNDTLYKLACSLRAKGISETAILAAVSEVNLAECHPPLEKTEVEQICTNACIHPEGVSGSLEGVNDKWTGEYFEVDKMWLKPLGHIGDSYFYISSSNLQITEIPTAGHTQIKLYNLLPHEFWQKIWGNKENKISWHKCCSELMQRSREKGIYSDRKIRGRGLWRDGGKVILHLGNSIIDVQSGQSFEIGRYPSSYIYKLCESYRPPRRDVCGTDAGRQLIDICESFHWKDPNSGKLLAGWLAIARLCGALKWRPHIWITGSKSTGKSTIMTMLIEKVLGKTALLPTGESTGAGVRQLIGDSAVPIIFDEAETTTERGEGRIANVIEFVRQCSSDGDFSIVKGTPSGKAQQFKATGIFCFSSIRVNVFEEQDKDRITVLELAPSIKEKWPEVRKKLESIDYEFGEEIWSKMIWSFGNFQKSIEIITTLLTKHYSARIADQFAPMIAGYWHLAHKEEIGVGEAEIIALGIVENCETAIIGGGGLEDENECLNAFVNFKVRLQETQKDVLMFDAIKHAVKKASLIDPVIGLIKESTDALRMVGVYIEDDGGGPNILIQTNHFELIRRFQGLRWGKNYAKSLARLPGAIRDRKRVGLPGQISCVVLPMTSIPIDVG